MKRLAFILAVALLIAWGAWSIAVDGVWARTPRPYTLTGSASAYGSCCIGGWITLYGVSTRLESRHSSIASPWLGRGTGVCITIPPQPGAHGLALRTVGAVKCDRPLTAEAVGDPASTERGRLTISDHLPAYHGRMLDLSSGFLRDVGFCALDEADYACEMRWGVRRVTVTVFG